MIIPYRDITAATLEALLEEYATRDGTDYGEREITLAAKVQQLQRQLEKGAIVVWFDENTQTVNLVAPDRLDRGHCQ